jgi:threonine dehydrogenase-like Zn-dependent dehydrogenase
MSAISPGTERLIYRGEAPSALDADASINALSGNLEFPLTYGYANVGTVEAVGHNVSGHWKDRRVFSFQPHTSHFVTSPENLIPLPESASFADGLMIPSLETAVNLVMDGHPVLGEQVVLFGQGVVGLLTTRLLGRHPVTCYTVEPSPDRRSMSEQWQADRSFHPVDDQAALNAVLGFSDPEGRQREGADLVYELSGNPSALNDALSLTGFGGRVIIGSWYGTKEVSLQLGGRFHRSRVQLKSSQVSTIDPMYQGRWTKERRMDVVLNLLTSLQPGAVVSDTFAVEEAPRAYRLLDDKDSDILQPVLQFT